jgi:hypothetical protein
VIKIGTQVYSKYQEECLIFLLLINFLYSSPLLTMYLNWEYSLFLKSKKKVTRTNTLVRGITDFMATLPKYAFWFSLLNTKRSLSNLVGFIALKEDSLPDNLLYIVFTIYKVVLIICG